jgi:hypothetical protein
LPNLVTLIITEGNGTSRALLDAPACMVSMAATSRDWKAECPDWSNFCLLGDSFHWVVFQKLRK